MLRQKARAGCRSSHHSSRSRRVGFVADLNIRVFAEIFAVPPRCTDAGDCTAERLPIIRHADDRLFLLQQNIVSDPPVAKPPRPLVDGRQRFCCRPLLCSLAAAFSTTRLLRLAPSSGSSVTLYRALSRPIRPQRKSRGPHHHQRTNHHQQRHHKPVQRRQHRRSGRDQRHHHFRFRIEHQRQLGHRCFGANRRSDHFPERIGHQPAVRRRRHRTARRRRGPRRTAEPYHRHRSCGEHEWRRRQRGGQSHRRRHHHLERRHRHQLRRRRWWQYRTLGDRSRQPDRRHRHQPEHDRWWGRRHRRARRHRRQRHAHRRCRQCSEQRRRRNRTHG